MNRLAESFIEHHRRGENPSVSEFANQHPELAEKIRTLFPALFLLEDLTQSGELVGTFRYMAPERFHGEADARSDVYSLGLTLYELLTLEPAFSEADRGRLMKKVLEEEPAPPRLLNPKIPLDLETVVLKAMAKECALRYQTAADLASDLWRFLAHEPVRARSLSPLRRAWRWGQHRAGLLAASGALLALLIAATMILWMIEPWSAWSRGPRLVREEGSSIASLRFSPVAAFSVQPKADFPYGLAAADFDGDRDVDLATSNLGTANITVFWNDGAGSFSPGPVVSAGKNPVTLIVLDLDGDQLPALAAANGEGGSITLIRNQGEGRFEALAAIELGFNPYFLAAADLDGDQDADLAASGGTYHIMPLWNKGSRTFTPGEILKGSPDYPKGLTAADFDGDQRIDLAAGCAAGGPRPLKIFLNQGGGRFALAAEVAAPSAPINLLAADLDGDQDLDLASTDLYSQSVAVFRNRGKGAFELGNAFRFPHQPFALAAADLDLDGDLDLATSSGVSREVFILLNQGDGTFPGFPVLPAAGEAIQVVAADLDGDGKPDLVSANGKTDTLGVFKNQAGGARRQK